MTRLKSHDRSVFAYDLKYVAGGYAYFSTITHWTSFGEHGRDIRAPSELSEFGFDTALKEIGRSAARIESPQDYEGWIERHGWALVECKLAYSLMRQWLKSHECIKDRRGTYTAIEISAPAALKHHAHRGIRKTVFERDGRKCADCGKSESIGCELTMHHLGARSHGYETSSRNLVPLCKQCNEAKGNQGSVSDFMIRSSMEHINLSIVGSRIGRNVVEEAMWISDNLMQARCEVF